MEKTIYDKEIKMIFLLKIFFYLTFFSTSINCVAMSQEQIKDLSEDMNYLRGKWLPRKDKSDLRENFLLEKIFMPKLGIPPPLPSSYAYSEDSDKQGILKGSLEKAGIAKRGMEIFGRIKQVSSEDLNKIPLDDAADIVILSRIFTISPERFLNSAISLDLQTKILERSCQWLMLFFDYFLKLTQHDIGQLEQKKKDEFEKLFKEFYEKLNLRNKYRRQSTLLAGQESLDVSIKNMEKELIARKNMIVLLGSTDEEIAEFLNSSVDDDIDTISLRDRFFSVLPGLLKKKVLASFSDHEQSQLQEAIKNFDYQEITRLISSKIRDNFSEESLLGKILFLVNDDKEFKGINKIIKKQSDPFLSIAFLSVADKIALDPDIQKFIQQSALENTVKKKNENDFKKILKDIQNQNTYQCLLEFLKLAPSYDILKEHIDLRLDKFLSLLFEEKFPLIDIPQFLDDVKTEFIKMIEEIEGLPQEVKETLFILGDNKNLFSYRFFFRETVLLRNKKLYDEKNTSQQYFRNKVLIGSTIKPMLIPYDLQFLDDKFTLTKKSEEDSESIKQNLRETTAEFLKDYGVDFYLFIESSFYEIQKSYGYKKYRFIQDLKNGEFLKKLTQELQGICNAQEVNEDIAGGVVLQQFRQNWLSYKKKYDDAKTQGNEEDKEEALKQIFFLFYAVMLEDQSYDGGTVHSPIKRFLEENLKKFSSKNLNLKGIEFLDDRFAAIKRKKRDGSDESDDEIKKNLGLSAPKFLKDVAKDESKVAFNLFIGESFDKVQKSYGIDQDGQTEDDRNKKFDQFINDLKDGEFLKKLTQELQEICNAQEVNTAIAENKVLERFRDNYEKYFNKYNDPETLPQDREGALNKIYFSCYAAMLEDQQCEAKKERSPIKKFLEEYHQKLSNEASLESVVVTFKKLNAQFGSGEYALKKEDKGILEKTDLDSWNTFLKNLKMENFFGFLQQIRDVTSTWFGFLKNQHELTYVVYNVAATHAKRILIKKSFGNFSLSNHEKSLLYLIDKEVFISWVAKTITTEESADSLKSESSWERFFEERPDLLEMVELMNAIKNNKFTQQQLELLNKKIKDDNFVDTLIIDAFNIKLLDNQLTCWDGSIIDNNLNKKVTKDLPSLFKLSFKKELIEKVEKMIAAHTKQSKNLLEGLVEEKDKVEGLVDQKDKEKISNIAKLRDEDLLVLQHVDFDYFLDWFFRIIQLPDITTETTLSIFLDLDNLPAWQKLFEVKRKDLKLIYDLFSNYVYADPFCQSGLEAINKDILKKLIMSDTFQKSALLADQLKEYGFDYVKKSQVIQDLDQGQRDEVLKIFEQQRQKLQKEALTNLKQGDQRSIFIAEESFELFNVFTADEFETYLYSFVEDINVFDIQEIEKGNFKEKNQNLFLILKNFVTNVKKMHEIFQNVTFNQMTDELKASFEKLRVENNDKLLAFIVGIQNLKKEDYKNNFEYFQYLKTKNYIEPNLINKETGTVVDLTDQMLNALQGIDKNELAALFFNLKNDNQLQGQNAFKNLIFKMIDPEDNWSKLMNEPTSKKPTRFKIREVFLNSIDLTSFDIEITNATDEKKIIPLSRISVISEPISQVFYAPNPSQAGKTEYLAGARVKVAVKEELLPGINKPVEVVTEKKSLSNVSNVSNRATAYYRNLFADLSDLDLLWWMSGWKTEVLHNFSDVSNENRKGIWQGWPEDDQKLLKGKVLSKVSKNEGMGDEEYNLLLELMLMSKIVEDFEAIERFISQGYNFLTSSSGLTYIKTLIDKFASDKTLAKEQLDSIFALWQDRLSREKTLREEEKAGRTVIEQEEKEGFAELEAKHKELQDKLQEVSVTSEFWQQRNNNLYMSDEQFNKVQELTLSSFIDWLITLKVQELDMLKPLLLQDGWKQLIGKNVRFNEVVQDLDRFYHDILNSPSKVTLNSNSNRYMLFDKLLFTDEVYYRDENGMLQSKQNIFKELMIQQFKGAVIKKIAEIIQKFLEVFVSDGGQQKLYEEKRERLIKAVSQALLVLQKEAREYLQGSAVDNLTDSIKLSFSYLDEGAIANLLPRYLDGLSSEDKLKFIISFDKPAGEWYKLWNANITAKEIIDKRRLAIEKALRKEILQDGSMELTEEAVAALYETLPDEDWRNELFACSFERLKILNDTVFKQDPWAELFVNKPAFKTVFDNLYQSIEALKNRTALSPDLKEAFMIFVGSKNDQFRELVKEALGVEKTLQAVMVSRVLQQLKNGNNFIQSQAASIVEFISKRVPPPPPPPVPGKAVRPGASGTIPSGPVPQGGPAIQQPVLKQVAAQPMVSNKQIEINTYYDRQVVDQKINDIVDGGVSHASASDQGRFINGIFDKMYDQEICADKFMKPFLQKWNQDNPQHAINNFQQWSASQVKTDLQNMFNDTNQEQKRNNLDETARSALPPPPPPAVLVDTVDTDKDLLKFLALNQIQLFKQKNGNQARAKELWQEFISASDVPGKQATQIYKSYSGWSVELKMYFSNNLASIVGNGLTAEIIKTALDEVPAVKPAVKPAAAAPAAPPPPATAAQGGAPAAAPAKPVLKPVAKAAAPQAAIGAASPPPPPPPAQLASGKRAARALDFDKDIKNKINRDYVLSDAEKPIVAAKIKENPETFFKTMSQQVGLNLRAQWDKFEADSQFLRSLPDDAKAEFIVQGKAWATPAAKAAAAKPPAAASTPPPAGAS